MSNKGNNNLEVDINTDFNYPKFIYDDELQFQSQKPSFSPILRKKVLNNYENSKELCVYCAMCCNFVPLSLCFRYTLNQTQYICLNCSIYYPQYRLIDWQYIQKPTEFNSDIIQCPRCGCYKTLDRYKISRNGNKRQKECSYCSLKKKRKYLLKKIQLTPR